MERERLIIYSQDVQRITGRSERYSRQILCTIKKHLGKQKHQFVTRGEFCAFAGLAMDDVERYMD